MKFYLAGAMRGIPLFNFPAFDEAAARLRAYGYEIVSPAEHDREIGFDETKNSLEDFDMKAALIWDIEQVIECDGLIALSCWENSSGVAVEMSVAKMFHKKIYEFIPKPKGQKGSDFELMNLLNQKEEVKNESILHEAIDIIKERQKSYSSPLENMTRIAKLWSAHLEHEVTPEQVADCMILTKLARSVNAYNRDNQIDIAGYAQVKEECAN